MSSRGTHFHPEFVAKYGFGGWDDPRPTSRCLHCHGTGKCDDHNECGFCFREEDTTMNDTTDNDEIGQCDCGTTYDVGSQIDHDAETGQCWDCSERDSEVASMDYNDYVDGRLA